MEGLHVLEFCVKVGRESVKQLLFHNERNNYDTRRISPIFGRKRDRAYRSSNGTICYLLADISRMERKNESYSHYG